MLKKKGRRRKKGKEGEKKKIGIRQIKDEKIRRKGDTKQ